MSLIRPVGDLLPGGEGDPRYICKVRSERFSGSVYPFAMTAGKPAIIASYDSLATFFTNQFFFNARGTAG